MYLKNEEDLGGLKCNCAFKIFKNCCIDCKNRNDKCPRCKREI